MLFDASIRKELSRSFGATLLVLVSIVMTMMLIRTLGQAAKGHIGAADVLLIMGLTVLSHLATVLALSLFIAIVAVLSRMYRDSEMVIWAASGRGLAACLRPVLRFAWPPLLAIAVLALVVWPWSHAQILQLRTQFEQRSDMDRIEPGQFQASADGARVVFVDDGAAAPPEAAGQASAAQPSVRNVFMVENRSGVETITSAQAAHVHTRADGTRWAVLERGQRMQDDAAQGTLTLTHFERYELLLRQDTLAQANLNTRATSTAALLGVSAAPSDAASQSTSHSATPENRAELGWRLSQPLMALNLVVLALAITHVNPRTGRNVSVAIALLAFIVYYNLNSVGQSWVATSRWPLAAFMGLHALVLALSALALAARHTHWRAPALLKWLRPRGA